MLAARRALGRFREALDDLGIAPDEATLMVERLLGPDPLGQPQTRSGAAPGSGPGRLAGR